VHRKLNRDEDPELYGMDFSIYGPMDEKTFWYIVLYVLYMYNTYSYTTSWNEGVSTVQYTIVLR
jgi:hypothetical protein